MPGPQRARTAETEAGVPYRVCSLRVRAPASGRVGCLYRANFHFLESGRGMPRPYECGEQLPDWVGDGAPPP